MKRLADLAIDIMNYHEEREDIFFFHNSIGFFTYAVEGNLFLCHDFYIKPEFRGTKKSLDFGEMVKSLGRSRGCDTLVGWVDLTCKNPISMHKFFKKFGAEVYDALDPEYHEYRMKL